MTTQDAAELLRHYALLLELLGEEAFRARTYENAARQLEAQGETLDVLIESGRLATVKGIGKSLNTAIRELAVTGTFAELEAAREQVPDGVLELLRVEGLGPKKARALWTQAGVNSLKALENALDSGQIEVLPGFGAKTAQKFRASLAFITQVSGRHWRHHALRAADSLRELLTPIAGIEEIFFGGSLRRNMETVGDLDVLLVAPENQIDSIRRAVLALENIQWTETGEVMQGRTTTGFDVDLSVCPPRLAGVHKVLATGSKEHRQVLRALAAQKEIVLESLVTASEEDVYAALGLRFVPPPLREGTTALRPLGGDPYPEPVNASQLRGILHVHTTASDGNHTLRELASATIEHGYEYLGIADHSQTASYAGGLTPDRVRAQWKEIDALNAELAPFRILKGTEADILADGRPDFDDELLAGFDFVIASIHSAFNMTEAEATDRLCRALENPHVDILGHATGRLLLERAGYSVDHERLLQCAAANGKAIELNSNPHRLDLDWRWLARAQELGVPVPLSPDAHHIEGLWDIRFGLDVAAKGPLTAANCPSTWSAGEFLHWCQTHKSTT